MERTLTPSKETQMQTYMEALLFLTCIIIMIVILADAHHRKNNQPTEGDQQSQPKRRRITRLVDIDGRVSFRGVPPEEWKALEEEYQRQEAERYNRR